MSSAELSRRSRTRTAATRVLPHSVETEASILGGIILRNEILDRLDTLEVEAFYDHRHKVVFQAIRNLAHAARPIDVVTLENEIAKVGKLDAIGGVAFLGELTLRVPTPDNVEAYAKTVRDHLLLRELMLKAGAIVEHGYNFVDDPHELLAETIADLQRLERVGKRGTRARSVLALADEIAEFARRPRLSWGFPQLDKLAPFPAGSVVVVIGATGRGKTAFLLQAAREHAKHRGPVLVVSAELGGAVAGARIVAQVTGRSWLGVLSGDVSVGDMREALSVPHDMRIVDEIERDILTVIERELVEFKQASPDRPSLVMVDYLQLLLGASPDPRERVTANMVALRKLATRFGAGVMLISKAGRTAARGLRSGEAMGTDVTEAGAETNAIEHEATAQIALGAMRPADPSDPDGPSIVDVSVAKSRFGQSDKVVPYRFDGSTGRFTEDGEAMSATDRRATAKAEINDKRVTTLMHAAEGLARASKEPLSKARLSQQLGGSNTDKHVAIQRLLDSDPPRLVCVAGAGVKRRGGAWPLWTPDRVGTMPGLSIVPKVVVDAS